VFSRLEELIIGWSPASRRRAAVHLFFWTAVAAPVNVALYVAGILNESHLILVTLVLSWLAITFTACDLIATTDVRNETENSPDG
jgi:hypothetical protein